MNLFFYRSASREMKNAAHYYEEKSKNLGKDFLAEVKRTLQLIAKHPKAWKKITSRHQQCPLHRFPYSIIYIEEDNRIVVVAVMHHHQKPNYWKQRKG